MSQQQDDSRSPASEVAEKPGVTGSKARRSRGNPENERRYFDALKTISGYMSPDQLRRRSEKMYGLPFEESLEYAYENVLETARLAVRGKRRPA